MIRSMTGYGRYEAENEESRLVVEIKSVNHRYCDISIRLPKNLNPFENIIRKQLKDRISRGKIDVFVTYEKVWMLPRYPVIRMYIRWRKRRLTKKNFKNWFTKP